MAPMMPLSHHLGTQDSVNAPFIETLDQEIADVDTHGILLSLLDGQMRLPYWKKLPFS